MKLTSTHVGKEVPLDLRTIILYWITGTLPNWKKRGKHISVYDLFLHISIRFWEVCDEFSGCVRVLESSNEEIVAKSANQPLSRHIPRVNYSAWGKTGPNVPDQDGDSKLVWSTYLNATWKGKSKYFEKFCPSATILSTINPSWAEKGSNAGRRGGKLATGLPANHIAFESKPSSLSTPTPKIFSDVRSLRT
jgi:hypothetical protein